MAMDDYGQDIISVTDEEGNVHEFECLDRIELENGNRYVALMPTYNDPSELVNDDGELIILRVEEGTDGESYLVPIEDEDEYEEVAEIFEDRLNEYYEIADEDDEDEE